jgi:SNF2 family DNA or RNA helicase
MELKGAREINDTKSKDEWNEGKIKIGVISPFSFQYGGNLQFGGHTIIWFGLMWGLENYLQSNKRIWRQGQKHDVKIMYLMMKNTWDDYVYKAVISKEIEQNDFLEKIDIKKVNTI